MAQTPLLERTLRRVDEQVRQGQLEAAEKTLRSILKTQPRHPVANGRLGAVLMLKGQPQAAIAFLEAAVLAQPVLAEHWIRLATAYQAAGQPDEVQKLMAAAKASGLPEQVAQTLTQQFEQPGPGQGQT